MADKKISDLTASGAVAAADLFESETGGNSRKVTGAQLQTLASLQAGYVATRWYYLQRVGLTAAGTAGQDTIQLTPFVLAAPITFSDLGAFVSTALAANNIQLAVYGNNPATMRPTGNALASTGNISTASAVAVSADVTGADVTLQPGIYWAAVNHSGATSKVSTASNNGAAACPYLVGGTSLTQLMANSTSAGPFFTVAQAFGTWPDLTSATITEVSTATAGGVALFFKAA